MTKFLVTFFAVLGFVGTADAQLRKPGGSGTPGGSSGQVQYNAGAGAFGGDSGMMYNATTNVLEVGAVNLPDSNGTNAHVLKGNESPDYDCEDSGSVSDGDIALVARGGDNNLYICDEDFDPADATTAMKTVGIRRGVRTETTATPYDIGTNAELEGYNGYTHICNNTTGECEFILPVPVASATAAMYICFGTMTSGGFNVDMADGVDLVRGGANCAAGLSIDSPSAEGSSACFTAVDADTWYLDESKGQFVCGG